jgi:hypothetical protein
MTPRFVMLASDRATRIVSAVMWKLPMLTTMCVMHLPLGSFAHDHGAKHPLPPWQTILPDTGHVLPLTDWSLSSTDQVYANLSATVPGDLLSDLMRAGIIDDPYVNRNFLSHRHVWMGGDSSSSSSSNERKDIVGVQMRDEKEAGATDGEKGVRATTEVRRWTRTWIYSTNFDIPVESLDHRSNPLTWKVVLEGIKMGAEIFVDGVLVGIVHDQFLRYEFRLAEDTLNRGGPLNRGGRRHELTVSFSPSIHVDGRFTACSGGWDWAPYGREQDAQGIQMFTLGIVKPVYVIGIERFAITHVVPKVYYLGAYPRTPLVQAEGDFMLDVDVHLGFVASSGNASLTSDTTSLVLETEFGKLVQPLHLPQTTNTTVVTLSLIVRKEDVELWWPNGMGGQPLYNVSVGTTTSNMIFLKRIGKQMDQWRKFVAILNWKIIPQTTASPDDFKFCLDVPFDTRIPDKCSGDGRRDRRRDFRRDDPRQPGGIRAARNVLSYQWSCCVGERCKFHTNGSA